jgi:DNA-binding SARP family transcriptional activator
VVGNPQVVELFLLGPLAGRLGGEPVVLGGPRQRAVLARLALSAGAVVPTERLVDELWDGDPPPSAVNTLQSYVSNLRRAYGAGATVIERAGPGYRLALEPEAIDARRFERLVSAALEGRATDPEAAGRHLEEALALWRGPALADFADEGWARADAVRLEELRLTAMEARFDVLLDTGRHTSAVPELDQAVEAHPLRERFCAQLILALYRSGRQAEALRAFERTRAHLADELGLDPTPELSRLAAAVLDHEPWLVAPQDPAPGGSPVPAPAAKAAAPVGPVAVPLPPVVSSDRSRSPFVGRRRELSVLEGRWARSSAGDRGVVVLAGEPGVGKTRLAMQMAQNVHDQGGYVLWGRCTAENLVAYQPVLESLRTCLMMLDPAVTARLLEPRPALAALLPGVAAETGVVPDRPSSERLELYETLAEMVEFVTRGTPALLVVDDLQWADTSSLSLLHHLVCHDRPGRLLVVATLRRPAGRPTAEVDRFIAELRRDQRLELVALEGVGVGEVAALLAERGVAEAEAVAPTVHARTAGNPFFVEELAGHGGDLTVDEGELPDSVRDMLDLRISALDPAAGRVLLAAAVIGRSADLDLLGDVCGMSTDELLDVTDPAVDAGLLVEDDEPGSVAFPHALVRQAFLARATRNREAQLHLRVADALERLPARFDRVASIAHHLMAAGRLCPPVRAAQAAVAAATRSLDVLAPAEGLVWARRAIDLVAGVEGDEARLVRVDARLAEGTASRHLGDRAQARASALAAAAEARLTDRPRLLARSAEAAMLATAGVGFDFGELDTELVDLLAEALERQPADDLLARADLLAWSAIVLTGRPDPARQLDLSSRALELSSQVDNPALTGLTLLARRLVLHGPDGLAERLALGPANLEATLEAGTTVFEVAARVLTVADLLEADRVDEARRHLEALRQRIAPFGRPGFDAYVHFLDANFALLDGDLDAAEAAATAGLEAGERSHGTNAVQAWASEQYLLAWYRGQLGALVPLVADMVEQFPAMPVWKVALAATFVAAGDPAAARAAYQPLVLDGLAVPEDSLWGVTLGMLAEVCWAVDDAEGAEVVAEALTPRADRVGVTGMGAVSIGHLSRPLGLALAAAGQLDRAVEALDAAVERSSASGFRTWLARSLTARAEVLARRGWPEDAERADRDRRRGLALAGELGIAISIRPPA